MRRNITHSKLW